MNFGIIVLLHNLGKLPAWLHADTHNIPNYHCLIFPAVKKLQHVIIISTLLL